MKVQSVVLVCVVLGLSLACIAALKAAQPIGRTETKVAAALQQLQRYKSSHYLNDLESAESMLDGTVDLDDLTPENFNAHRRMVVGAWAQVIKSIEVSYDPTYDPSDPNNVPTSCVMAPRESGGPIVRPCNVNPRDIQDPQTRASYVAAIAANALKNDRRSRYLQVSTLDQRAMSTLSASLDFLRQVAPDNTPSDFAALDSIIGHAKLSGARRKAIDAWFYARPHEECTTIRTENFLVLARCKGHAHPVIHLMNPSAQTI